jgi:guanylate kinase
MQEAQNEMSHYLEGHYIIINDDFNRALEDFKAIILSQRTLIHNQQDRHADLLASLLS